MKSLLAIVAIALFLTGAVRFVSQCEDAFPVRAIHFVTGEACNNRLIGVALSVPSTTGFFQAPVRTDPEEQYWTSVSSIATVAAIVLAGLFILI